jgi:hypothetical protein
VSGQGVENWSVRGAAIRRPTFKSRARLLLVRKQILVPAALDKKIRD